MKINLLIFFSLVIGNLQGSLPIIAKLNKALPIKELQYIVLGYLNALEISSILNDAHNQNVTNACISLDGKKIAYAKSYGNNDEQEHKIYIRLNDTAEAEKEIHLEREDYNLHERIPNDFDDAYLKSRILNFSFLENGQLFCARADGTIKIFSNPGTAVQNLEYKCRYEALKDGCVYPPSDEGQCTRKIDSLNICGKFLTTCISFFSTFCEQRISIWEFKSSFEEKQISRHCHPSQFEHAFAVSATGSYVALNNVLFRKDQHFMIESGLVIQNEWPIRTTIFSHDEKFLFTGHTQKRDDSEGKVKVWSLTKGTPHLLQILVEPSQSVEHMSISQNSNLLAVASLDGALNLYQLNNNKFVHIQRRKIGNISVLSISADGAYLIYVIGRRLHLFRNQKIELEQDPENKLY